MPSPLYQRPMWAQQAGTMHYSGRHPLDQKYSCGFDPLGKSLAVCVEHWRGCSNAECRVVLRFHEEMVVHFQERHDLTK